MTVSATYRCGACGEVASTVTLVEPGQPDPGLATGPPGVPPGLATLFASIAPDQAQISIAGGPISMSHGFVPMADVTVALESGDPAALFAIDSEYAPFWCPTCRLSYCREHYRTYTVLDEGFFDYTGGICPEGHERKLED